MNTMKFYDKDGALHRIKISNCVFRRAKDRPSRKPLQSQAVDIAHGFGWTRKRPTGDQPRPRTASAGWFARRHGG